MKFKKNMKKGFTLVELIVVIAIVAILAAVSVVSYLAFINSANESADIQLVKQLNVALQADETLNGPRDTMHEMLGAMEENGFVVENLTKTKSGYDIVWDQEHNRFGLLNGKALVYGESTYNSAKAWNIWKFADTKDEAENTSYAENKSYSVYLTEEFANTNVNVTELEIKAGLDVGNYDKLTSISYKNTSDDGQEVVIRTNNMFGKLTINAINDEVDHYGDIGDLDIQAIKKGTYDEFGRVGGIAKLTYGAIEVHDGGEITTILATPANDNKDDVKLTVENGGVVGTLIAPTETILTELKTTGVNHPEVLVLQEGESTVEQAIERTLKSVAYVLHEDTSRTYYESFDEACNKAATNETVVVLKDYQYETAVKETLITVASEKSVVIDLNGKIIHGILNNNKSCNMMKVNGNLTISDRTANSQGIGTGALRFGTSYSEAYAWTVSASIISVGSGNLTIKSGNVVTYSTASGNYAVDVTGAGSVTVNGGHIESGYIGIRLMNTSSSFTATGGEMIGKIWGVWFQSANSVNISGGYFGFTTDAENGRGISGYGTNTIITGGTVKNVHFEPGIDGCGYFDENGHFFGAAKYDNEKTKEDWEALGYSFRKPRTGVKYYQLTSGGDEEYMGAEDAIVGGSVMANWTYNNPYKDITAEVLAENSVYWEMYGLASDSVNEVPCSEGYHYSDNGDGTFTVVAD